MAIVVLAFGYYTVSPLFIQKTVDEKAPVTLREEPASISMEKEVSSTPTAVTEKLFPITGTKGHPASGTVRIIKTEDRDIIRYENFKTINGPDIYVYLAKDLKAKDFVSLGRVKATEGNINYDIPENIQVKDYKYVLVWCKTFGVLFNWAEIN